MLRTTSQQIIDSLGFQSGDVGKPMGIGAALDQASGADSIYTVPKGQVFLITHVVAQVDVYSNLGTIDASPQISATFGGVTVKDSGGTEVSVFNFRGFARWNNLFLSGGSPTWKTAIPGNGVVWKLKYPVAVPAGWTINTSATTGAWGNHAAVYGLSMDENHARTLGFSVNPSTTASERITGVAASAAPAAATAFITGRTGKSIRILDIIVRLQPETNATNILTIEQYDGSTSRTIWRIPNNNPSDMLEMKLSPDIFLKPGASLRASATQASTASINVHYEFVDADDVPGDHFWACIDPTAPTPGTSTVGEFPLTSIFAAVSTEITLYYPKKDHLGLTATATTPGVGYQHLLNGYVVGVQKAAVASTLDADATEQTKLCLSTGSAAGQIGLSTASLSQTNFQLSPVLSGSGHDQNLLVAVDGLNLPCHPDTGSVWVDSVQFNGLATTPAQTDADIAAWGVTVWGRTVPSFTIANTNRGN